MEGQEWSQVHEYFKDAARTLAEIRPGTKPARRELLLSQSLSAMKVTVGFSNSYGSKMLRMLRPDLCGVLDSRVRGRVEYEDRPEAFARYSDQLSQVAIAVAAEGIMQPFLNRSDWSVADVESVIYARLKGW